MPSDHFQQFFPAVCAGFGLLLVGLVNLALARRGVVVQACATLLVVASAIGFASSLDQPGATLGTARLLLFVLVPYSLLSSRPALRSLTVVVTSFRRPGLSYGLLTLTGASTVVALITLHDWHEARSADATLAELDLIGARGRLVAARQEHATTDCGNTIPLKEPGLPRGNAEFEEAETRALNVGDLAEQVIRRGPAGNQANCHGWVFTGGKFVLGPTAVALILRENGYQEIQEPRPGDLVVYRYADEIAHTAVVRYVSEGQPVLVEGKWGPLGVFLHPVEKSEYGTDYTFYRSSRAGHLLAGLGEPASPAVELDSTITE